MTVKIICSGLFDHAPSDESDFAREVTVTAIPGKKVIGGYVINGELCHDLVVNEGELAIRISHGSGHSATRWAIGKPEEVMKYLQDKLEEVKVFKDDQCDFEEWDRMIARREIRIERMEEILAGGLCDEAKIDKDFLKMIARRKKISEELVRTEKGFFSPK